MGQALTTDNSAGGGAGAGLGLGIGVAMAGRMMQPGAFPGASAGGMAPTSPAGDVACGSQWAKRRDLIRWNRSVRPSLPARSLLRRWSGLQACPRGRRPARFRSWLVPLGPPAPPPVPGQ